MRNIAAIIVTAAVMLQLSFKQDCVREQIAEDFDRIAFVSRHLDAEHGTENWTLLSDAVTATVYNAVPGQCDSDPRHTASMYTLNLDDVLSDRVIAMERTMMAEYGIRYGDLVLVEGTGRWDGIWQVQDTMNRRFAGQKKIDILVPSTIRHGKWRDVRVYVPGDDWTRDYARRQFSSI